MLNLVVISLLFLNHCTKMLGDCTSTKEQCSILFLYLKSRYSFIGHLFHDRYNGLS